MNPLRNLGSATAVLVALAAAFAISGCKTKEPADDATLTAQVQARLFADQNLSGQPIQSAVANGIATLDGTVTSDSARAAAAGDAAQVDGIKTVVNNLTVQAPTASASVSTPPPAPIPVQSASPPVETIKKPSPAIVRNHPAPMPVPAPIQRPAPALQPAPMPAPVVQAQVPPPPPPAPVVHNLTLAAGTTIPVRITQTLDSATTQTGDKFTGEIATDLIVDGLVALPQGTPVTGHVDVAQDAAHFKGSSLLTISLTAINRRGEHISVATDAFTKQGEGRGKNTAEKVGGGAAVGAILGGIFGGGKGAAIGAAAGGGVGAGANGVTRGQQVQISSETVVRFRLSDPIIVHTTTGGNSTNQSPSLERHTNE